jgi:MFS family permease
MPQADAVPAPDGRAVARSMRRNLWLLAICQGLFLTNNVTFIAINGLVGLALAPLGWMATLPVMGYVVGGALSTSLVARTQTRFGRKISFQLGLAVAIGSALLCCYAVYGRHFWLLVTATVIAGYYNANAQLYRFAAAELATPDFREKAVSLVMAGGLLGAIAGPNLAARTRSLTDVPFAGAYLALAGVALLAMALLAFIDFPPTPRKSDAQGRSAGPSQAKPAPSGGSDVHEVTSVGAQVSAGPPQARPAPSGGSDVHEVTSVGAVEARPLSEIMRQPVFMVAAAAGALGYGVMNLLMAATPIAMQICSLPFSDVATVLEWHVIGMFAPGFFTGHLIKRFGTLTIMGVGLALNIACVMIALSGIEFQQFLIALFLLGLGWNFIFTGSTTLALTAYRPEEKDRAQGALNFCVFATLALTSLASGVLVTTSGWAWLNIGSLLPLAVTALALGWLALEGRKVQNRGRR